MSRLSAPVVEQVLRRTLVARGSIARSDTHELVLRGGEGGSVVTFLPEVGATLAEGAVAVEVSGRPVFVLQGSLPSYRRITMGDDGDDVRQLQEGLARTGLLSGGADGVYGAATQEAVEGLYRRAGFDEPTPSVDEAAALGDAEDAVAAAQAEVDAPSGDPAAIDSTEGAERRLYRAAAQLDDLRRQHVYGVPQGEVVFAPALPAVVAAAMVDLGDDASGAVLELAGEEVIVEAEVAPSAATQVAPGDRAELVVDETGERVAASVVNIASEPSAETGNIAVRLVPDAPRPELAGLGARVDIEVAATPGPVLAVPLAALAGADEGGRAELDVVNGGEVRRVAVRVGFVSDGLAAVEPLDGAELLVGSEVVVGVAPPS